MASMATFAFSLRGWFSRVRGIGSPSLSMPLSRKGNANFVSRKRGPLHSSQSEQHELGDLERVEAIEELLVLGDCK